MTAEEKKPFYKRTWFIIIVIIWILGVIFGDKKSSSSRSSSSSSYSSSSQVKCSWCGKSFDKGTGYNTSFTGFKYRFMKDVKWISYSDWAKLPFLKYSSIQGLSINEIYTNYRSKLIQ